MTARVESPRGAGPWSAWAPVGADGFGQVVAPAGLRASGWKLAATGGSPGRSGSDPSAAGNPRALGIATRATCTRSAAPPGWGSDSASVRHLLPHRPVVAPDPAPAVVVHVSCPPGRPVPDHPGRARRDRDGRDPAAAGQAVGGLSPLRSSGRRPVRRSTRWSGSRSCPWSAARCFSCLGHAQHRPVVPVVVLLPPGPLLGGMAHDRRAGRPRGRQGAAAGTPSGGGAPAADSGPPPDDRRRVPAAGSPPRPWGWWRHGRADGAALGRFGARPAAPRLGPQGVPVNKSAAGAGRRAWPGTRRTGWSSRGRSTGPSS